MAITNLTNTTWELNETLSFESENTWNINFTSYYARPSYMGGGEYTEFIGLSTSKPSYMGNREVLTYTAIDGSTHQVYSASWQSGTTAETREITITGGDDVENPDLIAFLEANAYNQKPLEFSENKTALKIYEDLTEKDYRKLTKDENSFYLVNDVGLYKGEKLIATNSASLEKTIPTDANIIKDDYDNWVIQLKHSSETLSATDLTTFVNSRQYNSTNNVLMEYSLTIVKDTEGSITLDDVLDIEACKFIKVRISANNIRDFNYSPVYKGESVLQGRVIFSGFNKSVYSNTLTIDNIEIVISIVNSTYIEYQIKPLISQLPTKLETNTGDITMTISFCK